jgi:hypothetical protein
VGGVGWRCRMDSWEKRCGEWCWRKEKLQEKTYIVGAHYISLGDGARGGSIKWELKLESCWIIKFFLQPQNVE